MLLGGKQTAKPCIYQDRMHVVYVYKNMPRETSTRGYPEVGRLWMIFILFSTSLYSV